MALHLEQALSAATDVALQGGSLIRADFHRPGGDRGRGSHAAVDDEAERLIRDRLRSAFPDWSYLGEETGRDGPAEAHFRWLVDPNDGTRSHLEGRRGSAVSIALVKDGVPVLGVVHAPLAPDDSGDLIAWAEGLPLTRNGKEVERRTLPDSLEPEQVVLVSQDADQNPEANAQCAAPARYRALPSIAYRLALVAAGEAEAAVSLNGPVSWDFAGGHALLRAVGGTLLDAAGRPVEYDSSGGAVTSRVFGGSAGVAHELVGRDWRAVFEPSALDSLSELFPPPPMRGRYVADARQLSRAEGCLLGQVAGDALGGQVEFSTAAEIRNAFPDGLRELREGGYWETLAGQPTDDSELALILARTLVRDSALSTAALAEAYCGWLASGPFDVGGTISAGLHGHHNHESQANGSLMRASPLGSDFAFAQSLK